MDFWNNPEYRPLRAGLLVLVLLLVAIIGYLVFHSKQLNLSGTAGQAAASSTAPVTSSSSTLGFVFTTTIQGPTCSMNVCPGADSGGCVALTGTTAKDGKTCVLDKTQGSKLAQGMMSDFGGE